MWKTFRGFVRVALFGSTKKSFGAKVDTPPNLPYMDVDDPNYKRILHQALVVDAKLAVLRGELSVYKGDFKSNDFGERQPT